MAHFKKHKPLYVLSPKSKRRKEKDWLNEKEGRMEALLTDTNNMHPTGG